MVLSLLVMERAVPQLADGGMGQVALVGAALAPVVIPGALTTNRDLQTNAAGLINECPDDAIHYPMGQCSRRRCTGPFCPRRSEALRQYAGVWHALLFIVFTVTFAHGRRRANLLFTALGAGSLILDTISLLGTQPSRIRCLPVHERQGISTAAFRMQARPRSMVPQRSRSETPRICITEVDQCR